MSNDSRLSGLNFFKATTRGLNTTTGCNLLPSNNGTVGLAANWENIPETLLLNASIGFLLYMLFFLLTKIAWSQSPTEISGDLIESNNNLVTFLYGYRDPERWYVIPRYEFLRRSSQQHQHDLTCSQLYVPPKLPLANPIELLAFDSDVGDETESAEEIRQDDEENVVAKTMKSIRSAKLLSANKKALTINEMKQTEPASQSVKQVIQDQPVRRERTPVVKIAISPPKNQTPVGSGTGSGGGVGNKDRLVKFKSDLAAVAAASASASASATATATATKSLLNSTSTSPAHLSGSFFYPSILMAERLQASTLARHLNRFFAIFFRIKDADLIYAKGIDAYEYLLFQRHLILIMLVANIFCLGIILPVHWCFGQSVEPTSNNNLVFASSFQRTTIKNMSTSSSYYWAHIVSSSLIVIFAIMILSSYRDSIVTKNETQLARKTLLIGNIPNYQRNRDRLCQVFNEYFPRIDIKSIQFVYNTSRLEYYQSQLDTIMAAKEYCLWYRQKYNKELMVRPTDVNESQYCSGNCRLCSFLLICCCYWPCETKQPGSIFYSQQENNYRDKIMKDCEKLIQEPSEYAFVTLRSNRQAKRVMQELTKLKSQVIRERFTISWDKKSKGSNVLRKTGSASSINQQINRVARKSDKIGRDFFISDNNSASDPLDPNNNPHVKSIRSPIASRVIIGSGSDKSPTLAQSSRSRTSSENIGAGSGVLDGPVAWSIRYAPHPDNVEYYDILEMSKIGKYTSALLHVVMIIIFIFFTTPNVLLSAIERWSILQPEKMNQMTNLQRLLINYLSILLQIIATAILPTLIVLISKQIPYEDTSSKNHTIMWKTYLFLVLMVIIMPSIGMNSAQALLSSKLSPECLFPTDNGAYFVNYVVTSIFLSSVLELVKPIDVIFYYFLLWTSRSKAEFEGGRQYIDREFSVSMQHTGVLLVFTVVMTYMISCPLIAPAGLLYLIVKHAIDHYHLFYTYFTKKVDKQLQKTIEIFVRVALLLMLFQTTVAIYISTGTSYFSLISQIVFWLTLAVFLFNCCLDCTSVSSSSTRQRKRQNNRNDFCACFYLPRVIGDLLRANAIPESCLSRKI